MKISAKRVLVYTGGHRLDLPDRDVPLVEELRQRGFEVTYCVSGPHVANPGHPKEVAFDERFRRVQARWIDSYIDVVKLAAASDVVVAGTTSKSNTTIFEIANELGVATVQHSNNADFDMRYHGADWVCVRGEFHLKERIRRQQLPLDRMVITGSTQFDCAQQPKVRQASKEEFCKKYGLDPTKRIAVWLPSAPQAHFEWNMQKYVEICETVRDSGSHSLVIKAHPNDYTKRKSETTFNGQHTWEVLTPWASVVEPEDAYICYKLSDVGISTHSSVSMEFPLFHTPFIYVDADKDPVLQLHKHNWAEWFDEIAVPSLVGMYCSSDELAGVLAEEKYRISDPELFENHIAEFSYKNDGLAYKRIADVVERAAQESRSSGRAMRWAKGGIWLTKYGSTLTRQGLSHRKRVFSKAVFNNHVF